MNNIKNTKKQLNYNIYFSKRNVLFFRIFGPINSLKWKTKHMIKLLIRCTNQLWLGDILCNIINQMLLGRFFWFYQWKGLNWGTVIWLNQKRKITDSTVNAYNNKIWFYQRMGILVNLCPPALWNFSCIFCKTTKQTYLKLYIKLHVSILYAKMHYYICISSLYTYRGVLLINNSWQCIFPFHDNYTFQVKHLKSITQILIERKCTHSPPPKKSNLI